MRAKIFLLGLLLANGALALSGNTVSTDNVKARLVTEAAGIAPGQSVWVALELDIREGWHTYWRNPGDSGLPTSLSWKLPAGFSAGDIVWATPHRFEVGPLVNYGYAKHAVHLVQISAPKDLSVGTPITLTAKASWLVCADVCIPEDAELSVKLPTSMQAPGADPAAQNLFAQARAELPASAPAAARLIFKGGQMQIELGQDWGATLPQIKSLEFFPYAEGSIDYPAPQVLTRGADGLTLTLKPGYQPPKDGPVRGILLATEDSGGEQIRVPIEIAATLAGAARVSTPRAPAPATEPERPLATLLMFALMGGLILNLMPCVFPVLSIKALSVMEQAKTHPGAVRVKGLVFAAGVVSSMLVLAASLLVLRAGGEQLGWGFQLQSPLFVTLLVYLLLAVGLNLSGVFEVGGGLAGVGDNLTQGDSYSASFFTGVLATLVATPCSAPFMAPAVGAALTQSALRALLIFTFLGIGIALPFVLLSFSPGMRRILPKPGAWMDTLKQVFAFPVYATAAWLLWVVAQETSPFGLGAALAGTILVALAAWSYQKSHATRGGARVTVIATALLALLAALVLPVKFGASAAPATHAAAASDGDWQPYSRAKLEEITRSGKPLLVNYTASWCLTCMVNERNAFTDEAVQAVFKSKHVTLMKGDWTNRDPAITAALAEFGRAGVPLYVVYNGSPGAKPQVLPQLLTAGAVQSAFADAAPGG
jgi:thiol:disulfide interchange protein DsbD